MSLYIDQKYLNLISNKLPLFKKKKDHTYNCRCIICGDSAKKKNKARGYFFPHKTTMFYKCFGWYTSPVKSAVKYVAICCPSTVDGRNIATIAKVVVKLN